MGEGGKERPIIDVDLPAAQAPIVVVGNKCEVKEHDGAILRDSPEATVVFDWENGYVESSAKERRNIDKIFKELLVQAKSKYDFGARAAADSHSGSAAVASCAAGPAAASQTMKRRQSLPAVPVGLTSAAALSQLDSVGEEDENSASSFTKKKGIRDLMQKRVAWLFLHIQIKAIMNATNQYSLLTSPIEKGKGTAFIALVFVKALIQMGAFTPSSINLLFFVLGSCRQAFEIQNL